MGTNLPVAPREISNWRSQDWIQRNGARDCESACQPAMGKCDGDPRDQNYPSNCDEYSACQILSSRPTTAAPRSTNLPVAPREISNWCSQDWIQRNGARDCESACQPAMGKCDGDPRDANYPSNCDEYSACQILSSRPTTAAPRSTNLPVAPREISNWCSQDWIQRNGAR